MQTYLAGSWPARLVSSAIYDFAIALAHWRTHLGTFQLYKEETGHQHL